MCAYLEGEGRRVQHLEVLLEGHQVEAEVLLLEVVLWVENSSSINYDCSCNCYGLIFEAAVSWNLSKKFNNARSQRVTRSVDASL